MRNLITVLVSVLVLALVACGGGGGGGGGGSGGSGPVNYRVLDLTSGAVTDATSLPNLDLAPATASQMVFRRVPAAGAVGEFWIAVLELTQGQWISLTGDAVTVPWRQVSPSGVVGPTTTVTKNPAFGVIYDDLDARLATWNTGRSAKLRVPTMGEWEVACRAGGTGLFFWGDSIDPAVAGLYAVCNDNTLGGSGPGVVRGARTANGFGLWDTHGNVREWVTATAAPSLPGVAMATPPELRGGSWADNLRQSRAANRMTSVDRAFRHALSGARLVLVP